jgi:hypothetical protein
MLKEVGTSGQISLGKKYAGQLFDLVFHTDGRLELVPMKAVPTVVQEEAVAYRIGDGWLTPERLAKRSAAATRSPQERQVAHSQWEAENREALEAMNQRMAKIGSMGRRIHEWRNVKAAEAQSVASTPAGKVA